MSNEQHEHAPMRLPKEVTVSRALLALFGAILLPAILNVSTLIYNMGVIDTKIEAVDRRIVAASSRAAKVETKIDGIKTDISTIKMDVNGLEIKLKNVDRDMERVTRDVAMTRSQSISTERTVRNIKIDLDGAPLSIPINGEIR